MIEPGLRMPPADMKNAVTDNYIKAVNLNRKIITSAQLAQQSLYDMCMGFKEMRDIKLYKELGYTDFGDYCEKETGIKRRQVYLYIQVAENLPIDFVHSSAQIGIKKLYLLSTLSEENRTEIIENNDLESTSVRELEAQIKQIKAEKERALAEAQQKENRISVLEKSKQDLNAEITELQEEIEALENRPVEVAVSVDESREVANLKDAMRRLNTEFDIKFSEMQNENDKFTINQNIKHTEEMEKLKAEYEKKLAERPEVLPTAVPDVKEAFKAYLANAIDAANRLIGFVQQHPSEAVFKEKTKGFIKALSEKTEG